ncbi:MAG: DegT/DnrJ/EryC1/StrS aminotransferase family protein [Deltaproteobacteria bacterium]|nr:DegT/DnrJ/EryC1/StrS aminotransferase family protein [Deltaproteobacteria bacterium]
MTAPPWRDEYLVFGSPCIGEEERREVLACIDSRWLGAGPRVHRLESEFKDYVGAGQAVAVNSGTAALHLALLELGLPAGSEVITSAMTFCATANAIVHAGLVPVFADCDRRTLNIDLADAERRVTGRTRAIVPVHFAGRPCDMRAVMRLAGRHRLRVVEDCAHAIEATFEGRHVGTFGDFGCFSFYVTKNVTTVEGGMVVCDDARRADRIRVLASNGLSRDAWRRASSGAYVHYDVLEPGFKYNLTDIAASFGIHQLARIEGAHARRRELWDFYRSELDGLPLCLPADPEPGTRHALHLYTCLVDDRSTRVSRDAVLSGLHDLKIGSGVHYRALHLQSYYRDTFGYRPGDRPNAEFVGDRTFSIPLSPSVTDEDARDVVRAARLLLS